VNLQGLAISVIVILSIGFGHMLVIKWEYYWGAKTWPGMPTIGLGLIIGSLFVDNRLLSGALGIVGAALLWGILELFKQKKRVEKGLFPRNPGRKA
jgi:hypothetical protein